MIHLTRQQKESLKRVYERLDKKPSYLAFRRTVKPMMLGQGCVLVPYAGMMLGIEKDGYTHS